MELSEIFLIVWASVATVLAVLFHQFAKKLFKELLGFKLALALVADGKAEVVNNGDKIQIREVKA